MSTAPLAGKTVRQFLPSLGLMLGVQTLTSVCAGSIPVLAPAIAPDAAVAAADIGIYTMILYSLGMASAMVGGALVPRLGAIRVCQVAMLCCAVGLAFAATSHAIGLLLCALVLGCGMGAPTPASSHRLARVTPPGLLSLIFSIKQTGVPLGGALAGALLPALTLALGWRGAVLAVALCAVAGVLALQLARGTMDADRDPARPLTLPGVWATIGMIWADRNLRLVGIAAAILSAGQVCVTAFWVTYLVQAVGLSLTAAGFALAAAQIAGALGRVIWGAIADWSGRPLAILALLAGIAAAGMLLASYFPDGFPILAIHAVSVLLGATTIGWAGIVYAEVTRLAPAGRAAEASGGVTSVMFAGIVIGPAIFGAILRLSGSFTPAFVAMALALLAIVAAIALRLRRGGVR